MKRYVCGFAFSPDRKQVNLIEKKRPAWQNGKANGIGGHIEHNESPIGAMVREWQEETGIVTSPERWELCFVLTDFNRKYLEVCFFRSFSDFTKTRGVTSERVIATDVSDFHVPVIPNLRWIIPLLAAREIYFPLNIREQVTIGPHEGSQQ